MEEEKRKQLTLYNKGVKIRIWFAILKWFTVLITFLQSESVKRIYVINLEQKIVKLTNACFAKMILLHVIAFKKRGLAIVKTVRCDL